MGTKTMGPRNLGFVLSEANGNRSYATVTIASGSGKLKAGTVLGAIPDGGNYTASPNAETVDIEGAETATAILAYGVDATDDDVEAVIFARDGEVKSAFLVFDDSVDDATKIGAKHTQLAAANIHVR